MIYVVKTNDKRLYYLAELLKTKTDVIWSNTFPVGPIDLMILPFEGIDEFGYIKNTTLNLEKLFKNNCPKQLVTGRVNGCLKRLASKYKVNIFSFLHDRDFIRRDFFHQLAVIKHVVAEKQEKSISEVRFLVLGGDEKSYFAANYFECDLFDKSKKMLTSIDSVHWNNYEVIVNYDNPSYLSLSNQMLWKDKLIIEGLSYPYGVDLTLFYDAQTDYYLIDQLVQEYLTKSGAKIMADCLVRMYDSL